MAKNAPVTPAPTTGQSADNSPAENTDFQSRIDELTSVNEALLSEKNALAEEKTTLINRITDLEGQLAAKELELSVYEATQKELNKTVVELSDMKNVTTAEVKATPTHEGKSFEYEGGEYGFNYPKTSINRVPVTVDDVLASTDLQKQLIDMKSGMVYKK